MNAPQLKVTEFTVTPRGDRQITVAVIFHEGVRFDLYLDSDDALSLSGELESAYQQQRQAEASGDAA